MKDENGKEQFREYSKTLTLEELEVKLENSRQEFFKAIVTSDPLRVRYLEAYTLASDVYYARKWNSAPLEKPPEVPRDPRSISGWECSRAPYDPNPTSAKGWGSLV